MVEEEVSLIVGPVWVWEGASGMSKVGHNGEQATTVLRAKTAAREGTQRWLACR